MKRPQGKPCLLFLVWSALLCVACAGSEKTEEELWLGYKEPGMAMEAPRMDWVVQIQGRDTPLESRESAPAGMAWGTSIRVRITKRKKGAFFCIECPYEITKKTVETTAQAGKDFRMHSVRSDVIDSEAARFRDDGKTFVSSPKTHDELLIALSAPKSAVDLVFRHGPKPASPLVLVAVEEPTCKWSFDCVGAQECIKSVCTVVDK